MAKMAYNIDSACWRRARNFGKALARIMWRGKDVLEQPSRRQPEISASMTTKEINGERRRQQWRGKP